MKTMTVESWIHCPITTTSGGGSIRADSATTTHFTTIKKYQTVARNRYSLSFSLFGVELNMSSSSSSGGGSSNNHHLPFDSSNSINKRGVVSSGKSSPDDLFQRGIELEQQGLAREALEAFEQAASMYEKTFLNNNINDSSKKTTSSSSSRKKVVNTTTKTTTTITNQETLRSLLAYTYLRLGHLHHDYLGNSRLASELYKKAIDTDYPNPSSVAYDGWGTSLEASSNSPEECGFQLRLAIDSYRRGLVISPKNQMLQFHLAVALERFSGGEESSKDYMEARHILDQMDLSHRTKHLVNSWGYVRWHTRKQNNKCNLYRGTRQILQLALESASHLIYSSEQGLVCEFGVATGRSTRMTREMLSSDIPIYGFDTFEGLPQAWGNEPAGTYSTDGVIPSIEGGNVHFIKGLFSDTLPQFVDSLPPKQPIAFMNIDCDLYTSTCDVLEILHERIVPGTILVFDEYICHPTWREDEFRAWRECCKKFGWRYEYLAFSLSSKQAVVRVINA